MTKTKVNKELSKIKDDLVSREKLDLWVKHKFNVLFRGRHGVGKTHIILKAFKRARLRYAYFSGATMDPFVDFVGIPITVVNPSTGKTTIRIQRPEHLAKLDAQAFFFDEFNRTHKKIRNAVMELMQFKTINGTPISSDLQMIWAAVNPDDDEGEYDVDRLDPAQEDRFQIQVDVPYKCSVSYFIRKYGDDGKTAVQFWNKLEKPIQDKVSPRRLDYVLSLYTKGGDIRDALPVEANPSRLKQLLHGKGYQDLEPLLADDSEAEKFFKDENNYAMYIKDVLDNTKFMPLLDSMPDEKIAALLNHRTRKVAKRVAKYIQEQLLKGKGVLYKPILKDIVDAGINYPMVNWADKLLKVVEAKEKKKLNKTPKGRTLKQQATNITNSKSLLLYIFTEAKKHQHHVSAIDIQKAYVSYLNKHRKTSTIFKVMAKLIPWLATKGLNITAASGSSWKVL